MSLSIGEFTFLYVKEFLESLYTEDDDNMTDKQKFLYGFYAFLTTAYFTYVLIYHSLGFKVPLYVWDVTLNAIITLKEFSHSCARKSLNCVGTCCEALKNCSGSLLRGAMSLVNSVLMLYINICHWLFFLLLVAIFILAEMLYLPVRGYAFMDSMTEDDIYSLASRFTWRGSLRKIFISVYKKADDILDCIAEYQTEMC